MVVTVISSRASAAISVDVVVGAAVGVAVGQQDDVPDGPVGLDEVAPRDVERVLEVGAAAVLQRPDARRERVAAVARPVASGPSS